MKQLITLLCILFTVASSAFSATRGGRPDVVELRLEKRALTQEPTTLSFVPLSADDSFAKQLIPTIKGLPDGWTGHAVVNNFPQLLYQGFCAGKVDAETCMRYFNAWGRDTTSYTATPGRVYHLVATHRDAEGAEHVMFDTDGNCDFTGESNHLVGQQSPLVKVVYDRMVGKRPVADSTWLCVVKPWGDESGVMTREMTEGRFTLDGVEYTCSMKPSGAYDERETEITIAGPHASVECEPTGFVRVGGGWYKIDSVAPDGRYVRLKHTPDAEKQEALQIGFRPYAFTAVDMNGKKVRFPEDFAGKYVLLDIWALSCGPCVQEITQEYPQLYKQFRDHGFEIVGVADNTADQLRGFVDKHALPWVVVASRDNGDIVGERYKVESFPTLFLLGPDGRIVVQGSDLRGSSLKAILQCCIPGAQAAGAY